MSSYPRRLTLSFVGFGLLAACSRNNTTSAIDGSDRRRIYRLSDEEAMRIAHGTFVRSFPGRRVETIDGPTRGYSTWTRFGLDTSTQQVLVQPVAGVQPNGQDVEGYVSDVSGSGTAGITGGSQNVAFFQALREELERTGLAADVVSMRPRRVVSSVAPTTERVQGDPIDQLRRLQELHGQGGITSQEYDRARADLLRRL